MGNDLVREVPVLTPALTWSERAAALVALVSIAVLDVARAYGGHGVRVTDRTALAAACRAALASDRFILIEAVVDKAEYAGQM